MWIANQMRSDIANAVRAVVRFYLEPELTDKKAIKTILDVGLKFSFQEE